MKTTPIALTTKEAAAARGGLDFASALQSPCASCDDAPCCSHLPLPGFPVQTLMQVDHARWLLGFEGIELGISSSGDWSVFYTGSCRFLDDDRRCTLHGTGEQPSICVHYNPYTCWYRGALGDTGSPDYVRIDAQRLAAILPHLLFDDDRSLVEVPTWEALHELVDDLPMTAAPPPPAPLDPVIVEWREIVLGERPPRPQTLHSLEAITDPCTSCAAHCCTTLQFPVDVPSSASGVDYLRFALGFNGVELGVADDGWSLIVTTSCRHLDGNRCGLFGQPDRPLRCQYFDAAQCPYPTLLGSPRPAGFTRVDLDRFPALVDCLSFDGAGNLVGPPTADEVRDSVEDRWRKERQSSPPA